jgi:preprotein translocase subunit YajC
MNTAEISFIIILAVMAAFYLIFIRPQQREQKEHQETIRDLHVGDEVITTGSIFARVKEIHTPEAGPVEIVLELADGLEVRALTSAVARRVGAAPERAEQQREEATGS